VAAALQQASNEKEVVSMVVPQGSGPHGSNRQDPPAGSGWQADRYSRKSTVRVQSETQKEIQVVSIEPIPEGPLRAEVEFGPGDPSDDRDEEWACAGYGSPTGGKEEGLI